MANFIKKAIKHPGALHEELGVPKGQKIPAKKMAQAEHSSNPKERKRAQFAKELEGFGGVRKTPEYKGLMGKLKEKS
jgi:hypothetical protein